MSTILIAVIFVTVITVICSTVYYEAEEDRYNVDQISRSISVLKEKLLEKFDIYPIARCPICGKYPEVKYRDEYKLYDIYCKSYLAKTPHFAVFGLKDEPKKSVIKRWNEKVRANNSR